MTKIIANRLREVLPKIISENQGGFLQKRKIVDNIILVQEMIHTNRANKEKCMVIKIDMENAFDWVRHSFLLDVMHKFGFSPSIIRWIVACISTPWIAPLVNGRPTPFFHIR
jgi:hypothetical protein